MSAITLLLFFLTPASKQACMDGWIILKKQSLDKHSLPWPGGTSFAASHWTRVGSIAPCMPMCTLFESCWLCLLALLSWSSLSLSMSSVPGPHDDVVVLVVVLQPSKCDKSCNCTWHCNTKQEDCMQCSHCKELAHGPVVVHHAKSVLTPLWIGFYSMEQDCICPY